MSIIDAYELDELLAKAEELEKAKALISDLKKKVTSYEDFIQHHNRIALINKKEGEDGKQK